MEPEAPQKRDCCICFNNVNSTTLTKLNCEKMLKNWKTYLDTSINIRSFENETHVPCCGHCYEYSRQLESLEEQIQQLQKEISDLSSIFLKNVLERRIRVKNGKDEDTKNRFPSTKNCLTIHKNYGGYSISVIETVSLKQEFIGCESKELSSDSPVKKKTCSLVTDMRSDEDEQETIHKDECENEIHIEEDLDIKYSYNETFPKSVDTVNKHIVQQQRLQSANPFLGQPVKETSTEELLKTVKMPVIRLKRLQPRESRNSPKIVSAGNEMMKCEKGLGDSGHSAISSENHVNRFQCPEISCSKSFKTEFDLNRHKTMHSEERPFKCSLCFKSFKASSNLNKHKMIHSEKRPHQCSLCGKSFKRVDHLKDHGKFHSAEKPYPCSFCEKRFKQAGDAKRHERTIHMGERPYKCSICEQSFKNPYTAKAHEIIHTGERPYKCSNCEKSFTQNYQLTFHECQNVETTEEFILS